MATETLLHLGDGLGQKENFQFDHAMSHRNILGAMAPLYHWSAVPYWVDPQLTIGPWYRDHQQAHNDFVGELPPAFGWTTFGFIGTHQNLIDTKISNPDQRSFWLFANHIEHFIGENVLPWELTFPFW